MERRGGKTTGKILTFLAKRECFRHKAFREFSTIGTSSKVEENVI